MSWMIHSNNATFETTCLRNLVESRKPIQIEIVGIAAVELALPEPAFAPLQHPQHLPGRYGGDISGYAAFECSDRVAE